MSQVGTDLLAKVRSHSHEIQDAARRHHGLDVWVFGSVARGDESAESDVDFLVRFGPGSSLFDLMRLQDELAALLGRPVDVVSSGALTDRDAHILSEAVAL
jgi:predicted nucleotidyltransferase